MSPQSLGLPNYHYSSIRLPGSFRGVGHSPPLESLLHPFEKYPMNARQIMAAPLTLTRHNFVPLWMVF